MNLVKSKHGLVMPAMLGTLLMTQAAYAELAPAGNYKVDPDHTTVLFSVSHFGFSELTGRFNKVEGEFVFNPKAQSKVNVTIKTDSVDTNHSQRDKHLRSPDFLNVKQFPVMQFKSSKVVFDNKGQPTQIIGQLSLHGKTKPVTLDVKPVGAGKDPWGSYRAGYNAKTRIKRSDYGIDFMKDGIGDTIDISLNIEALKQ